MIGKVIHWKGWTFFALCCVALAIWLQGYTGRLDTWRSLNDYCQKVTIPSSVGAAERDKAMTDFARRAAEARRESGDYAVADDYDTIADEADIRRAETAKRAKVPCSKRFPRPSVAW